MQRFEHISGLVAAPFTPMKPSGRLNLAPIPALANSLAANGVVGAFVCGSTGESMSLTTAERMQVAQKWAEVAPKGFKIIIHAGHTCIEASKALAAHAQETGAYAIAVMAPCYFKPTSVNELVDYCADVAAAAPRLPFYYYHIPSMTGVHVPVYNFLQAAEKRIRTLAGAKFTYEDLMDLGLCLSYRDGRYDILFGRDEILLAGLALGVKGAVGTTYNFAAPIYHRIISAFEAGNLAAARNAQKAAMDMIAVFKKYGGLPAGKAIMKMLGFDCGPVRTPLRSLTPSETAALRSELKSIGFFSFCSKKGPQ